MLKHFKILMKCLIFLMDDVCSLRIAWGGGILSGRSLWAIQVEISSQFLDKQGWISGKLSELEIKIGDSQHVAWHGYHGDTQEVAEEEWIAQQKTPLATVVRNIIVYKMDRKISPQSRLRWHGWRGRGWKMGGCIQESQGVEVFPAGEHSSVKC